MAGTRPTRTASPCPTSKAEENAAATKNDESNDEPKSVPSNACEKTSAKEELDASTPSTSSTAFWIALMCISQLAMYVCGKRAMQVVRLPTLLCLAQFGASAILTTVPSPLTGPGWRGLKFAQRCHAAALLPLCLLWAYAFVLLNAGISMMSASLATAVRAMEPLSAVTLGFLIFGERYSGRLVATLAPICMGVAMTSYGGGSMTALGFLFTWVSNFGFASRPFLAKRLAEVPGEKLDNSSVYFNVCAASAVALIPAFTVLESSTAISAARTLLEDERSTFTSNVALSSLGFFLYQFAQLVLMSRLSNITFSVVTPLSKAFVTICCAIYFGDSMTPFNVSGIGVSTLGVLLFSVAKRKDTEASARAEKKDK